MLYKKRPYAIKSWKILDKYNVSSLALSKMFSLFSLVCLRHGWGQGAESYLTSCPPSLVWSWQQVVGSKVQKTSSPLGVLRVVKKRSMPDAQSSGLWRGGSCLPLFVFVNKSGLFWDPRLLHSWLAVLHYRVHIRCCSYTSRMTCQRELSTEYRITCAIFVQLLVCVNVLYMHVL